MLSGIQIYSSDSIWRQILRDLNADLLDAPNFYCVNFDELDIVAPISVMQLKSIILSAMDYNHMAHQILGDSQDLSQHQAKIVVLLHKSGGMTAHELKNALGFAPNVATHTVDTAIYQLRKIYGRDFIKNINGVYYLGEL